MAISLLSELLRLDWRKRINAIDALKHPYFSVAPLPARPGELPHFEDSHELDRRKFRGQKAAMPPAPAGGSVGMGPNGGWTANSGPRTGPESRKPRIPGGARPRGDHYDAYPPRTGDDGWPREGGLPPKPPVTAHQNWGRDGRADYRRDRPNNQQPRFGGRPESGNSYAPNYGPGDRYRNRDGYYNPGYNADGRYRPPYQGGRRNPRDYPPRRRSRSPGYRYGGPGPGDRDRGPYRR
jgi:serine/threonine-protein kinase BUR1